MLDADSDLVSILVPKAHVMQIYRFISTLEHGTLGVVAETPSAPWSPEMIRRQFDESPDIIKRFQKILANHPGKRFLTSEMAAQLKAKKGAKTVAGALGAYGRRTANRYKMETWPFKNEWNHPEKQQTYWMEPEVAALVKNR